MAHGADALEALDEWMMEERTLKAEKTAEKVVKAKCRCDRAKKSKVDAEMEVAWAKRLCAKALKVRQREEMDAEKANSCLEKATNDLARIRRRGKRQRMRVEEGVWKNRDRIKRFMEELVEEVLASGVAPTSVAPTSVGRSGGSSSSSFVPKDVAPKGVVPADVSSDEESSESTSSCCEGTDSS